MIAFDAATNASDTTGTSHTFSHTCTGSDLRLYVQAKLASASDLITGVTYNGVAMTRVDKATQGSETVYLYRLCGPAVGAHNVVISASGSVRIDGRSSSYTGASQSNTGDASATATTASATSLAVSLTVSHLNCWIVAAFRNNADNAATAGANTTLRAIDGIQSNIMGDSNGFVAPGSRSLNYTFTSAAAIAVAESFEPSATSGILLMF